MTCVHRPDYSSSMSVSVSVSVSTVYSTVFSVVVVSSSSVAVLCVQIVCSLVVMLDTYPTPRSHSSEGKRTGLLIPDGVEMIQSDSIQ
jgi:hypothetical protein